MVGLIRGLREHIVSFGVDPIRASGNLKILDAVCTHHKDLQHGVRNSKSSELKTESAASVSGAVRFDGGNFENWSGGSILSADSSGERGRQGRVLQEARATFGESRNLRLERKQRTGRRGLSSAPSA